MNKTDIIAATLEFMKRVPLKGEEVAVFVEVNNWLNSEKDKASGQETPASPKVS